MSASFSKHTFSRSIFRTVTCNKVRKEQRCSCLCVSHLDLVVVSLSGPEKGEYFFFQGKIISVAFFSFFYTALSLHLPFLFPPCSGLLLQARRRGMCFLCFNEEDRRVEEVGSSRKTQMFLTERNS